MSEAKCSRGVGGRVVGTCAALALGLVLLSGCRSGGSTSANNNSAQTSNMSSGAYASGSPAPGILCDPITRVTINERAGANKEDQYTFVPNLVTIKAGQFITFDNQSDSVHLLVATPSAGLPNSAIDRNEDQPVQFTKAGTYTLESQDAKHRATMQVVVTAAAGKTCGMSAPGANVTFTEKHAQGKVAEYAMAPKLISLNVGQSVELVNQTDQALNFSCKPSADVAEGNLRVDKDEQQVVPFVKAGQYTCTGTEEPAQTMTIVVH